MLKRMGVLVALLVAAGGGGYAVWVARTAEPPLGAATRMIAAGNLFGAQTVLRGVIKAHPRDIEAHTALIQTLLATADWLSVEREAKTLRALGVARTAVAPMLVRSYANQKRYADILLEVPAVASRPEEQAMNLALRSVGLLGLGQLPQAQAALDAAAALAPDDFLVRLQKARLALARRDGPGAMREVDAALAAEPASTEALWVRSEAFRLEWDLPEAIGELDKAVAVAPLSQDLRMARAGLLLSAGWDKQALDDVRAVFAITPSNLTALFYHSLLMMRAGRVADAAVEFDKLGAAIDQFPKAHFYKAQIALAQGNRQSARESLGQFLRLQPADAEGLRLAARLEMESGRPERAVTLLSRLQERDAGSVDLEGRALFMMGRMTDAVASFRQATTLAPDNREFASHLAAAQSDFGTAPAGERGE